MNTSTHIRILTNAAAAEIVSVVEAIVCVPVGRESAIPLPPLIDFVLGVASRSNCDHNSLSIALFNLKRIQQRMRSPSIGQPCSRHRMFLASLIITKKYVTDAPIKNKSWVPIAGHLFSLDEINMMERQLLQLLEYRTLVTERDLLLVVPTSSGCPARCASPRSNIQLSTVQAFLSKQKRAAPPPHSIETRTLPSDTPLSVSSSDSPVTLVSVSPAGPSRITALSGSANGSPAIFYSLPAILQRSAIRYSKGTPYERPISA
ncbi:UNVERIFIED_CONTAM: hypothetical protein HDU68_011242 [Siphonaria sp. JEL0065]|nr:hypothetical protein HDU68_011242 [Siphonaria sp. JEL0065]